MYEDTETYDDISCDSVNGNMHLSMLPSPQALLELVLVHHLLTMLLLLVSHSRDMRHDYRTVWSK